MPQRLFPLFLKLDGRRCLVAGAGAVAESKIASLLDTGAQITVVAPKASAPIAQYAAEKKVRWIRRKFRPADLRGVFLAIAATSDPHANRILFEEARRRGVLCNTVDDPPHCDFYFPALVQRGDLQIAVSTAGRSPAFAQRLRSELDEALDASLGARVHRIGVLRRRILEHCAPSPERSRTLRLLAYRDACDLAQCPAREFSADVSASPRQLPKSAGRNGGE